MSVTDTPETIDAADNFGAGVFTEATEPEKVELTPREIAIARGDDPDEKPVDESVVEEVDESPEIESSAETEQDPFSEADRSLASQYGITDEELLEFGSPQALRRAVAVIDRSKPKKPVESAGVDTESTASDAASSTAASDPEFVLIDPAKYADFDEETQELVKSFRATQEKLQKNEAALQKAVQYIESQEQAKIQEETAKARVVFHDTLDKMPDVFGVSVKDGKSVTLTTEQLAAREKVREAAETIWAGVQQRGQSIELPDLLQKAISMVHGQPRKPDDRRASLTNQSAKRRTTGSSAATTRRVTTPPADGSIESIAKHPAIDRFWREAQESNGTLV